MLYRPLVYFVSYILFTMSVSFFGPMIFVDYDKISIFIFISLFLIIFSFGYFKGVNKRIQTINRRADARQYTDRLLLIRSVKVCIITSAGIMLALFIRALLAGNIHLTFAGIGANYTNYYIDRRAGGGDLIFDLLFLFSGFLRLVATVFGIYYFNRFSRSFKILIISNLVLTIVVFTVSMGNQKSLGDLVVYLLVLLFVKTLDMSSSQRRKTYFALISVGVLFCCFISIVQYQRLLASGTDSTNLSMRLNELVSYDWDHVFFKIFGEKFGLGLATFLTGYLSAGYYGLSLCLKLPFVWTYGVGSSFSLMVVLERFFGVTSQLDRTYLLRMEYATGRNGLASWNTIFPWLASDITFVGSLLIFFPFAYVYAVCWKEIVKYRNPLSLLMFSMLSMGLVFIPANNQLMHGFDGFLTTVLVSLIWLLKHKRYNTDRN